MKTAEEISTTPKTVSLELIDPWLPGSWVGGYVVSADIQVKKPLQQKAAA